MEGGQMGCNTGPQATQSPTSRFLACPGGGVSGPGPGHLVSNPFLFCSSPRHPHPSDAGGVSGV